MRRRPLIAVTTAVALTTLLAACGGDPAASEQPVPTKAAATATPTPTVEPLSAENVVARLEAAAAAQASYDVTMEVTGPTTMSATGSFQAVDGQENFAMRMNIPGMGDIETVFVGGLLYLKIPALLGDQYLQIDPNDASNPLAAEFAGIGDEVGGSAVEGLEDAVTSVEKAGAPEQLDGVEVQPYTVVVDTTKLPADKVAELMPEGAPSLPPTITYSYWVDADDLLRKVRYELVGLSTTLTMTNFGTAAPVTAPPADQVTTEMPF